MFACHKHAIKKIDDDTIALILEEKNPALKSMLISAIQLKREKLPDHLRGSLQMIDALNLETLKHVRDIQYSKVYKRLRLVVLAVFLVGGAAATIKYSTSYPEAVKIWFLRVLKPGADIAPFSFTKIDVEPKSKAILRGDNVKINANLTGDIRDSVTLHAKQEGGEQHSGTTCLSNTPTKPRTPKETSSASCPSSSQSRRRLSNQGLWPPISYRSWRRVMSVAP